MPLPCLMFAVGYRAPSPPLLLAYGLSTNRWDDGLGGGLGSGWRGPLKSRPQVVGPCVQRGGDEMGWDGPGHGHFLKQKSNRTSIIARGGAPTPTAQLPGWTRRRTAQARNRTADNKRIGRARTATGRHRIDRAAPGREAQAEKQATTGSKKNINGGQAAVRSKGEEAENLSWPQWPAGEDSERE
ncbi:hypothetical protein L249_2418 [Ophiocordyceps polyrhachis-furcata BCC 54312]|uniref:Uncharacterized protein n=1 Tax=Ophiocordyceps polyrhachis-furcata BCC 54312 TaxID=1330021 RepID=A0A367LQ82_9HYPO|nr:hypothetical protein L249_2418 [Ophiocordyceps polyrhachis-furcata BCC 54312]